MQAGQGWVHHFGDLGVDVAVKLGQRRHGRRLAIFEYASRAGQEPPDHTHATEDEIFSVLSGQALFRCGPDRFEVCGGGFVFLPRGIEHGYEITIAGEVRFLVIIAPAPGGGAPGRDGFVGRFEQREQPR